MSDAAVLDFSDVACVAGGIRLFDSISFTIASGERIAIIGDSGNGKTLIARLALGLAQPISGNVTLFGVPTDCPDREALRRVRSRCGLALQGGSLLGSLDVEENLWLGLGASAGARQRLRRKLDRIMLEFQIDHLATMEVNVLSEGERRRVELARAFLRDPELVILDEPLDGARANAAHLERRIVRQTMSRGRALLLLTQDSALAERLCDRVLRIERSRLVQQPAPAFNSAADSPAIR